MSPRKTYFVGGLFLVLAGCVLFLFVGRGVRPEPVQLDFRYFVVVFGSHEASVMLLPMLILCSAMFGALGSIQAWVALPPSINRIAAALFVTGMGFQFTGFLFSANGFAPWHLSPDTRWILFVACLFLVAPVLLSACGLVIHSLRPAGDGRVSAVLEIAGGNMKAGKLYAFGGLLLFMFTLLRTFWPGWPLAPVLTSGVSSALAQMWTSPYAATLSAVSLFLASVQPQLPFPERLKVLVAIAYLAAAGAFVISLHADLLRERWFDHPMSGTTTICLAMVAAAVLCNLIGMLRQREPKAASNFPVSV